MRSLSTVIRKEFMDKKFQISYDVKNCQTDFKGNYDNARKSLLNVLKELNAKNVESHCESTLIVHFDSSVKNSDIEKKFKENLSEYFHYSISLISISSGGKYKISNSTNSELNKTHKKNIKRYCHKSN